MVLPPAQVSRVCRRAPCSPALPARTPLSPKPRRSNLVVKREEGSGNRASFSSSASSFFPISAYVEFVPTKSVDPRRARLRFSSWLQQGAGPARTALTCFVLTELSQNVVSHHHVISGKLSLTWAWAVPHPRHWSHTHVLSILVSLVSSSSPLCSSKRKDKRWRPDCKCYLIFFLNAAFYWLKWFQDNSNLPNSTGPSVTKATLKCHMPALSTY